MFGFSYNDGNYVYCFIVRAIYRFARATDQHMILHQVYYSLGL